MRKENVPENFWFELRSVVNSKIDSLKDSSSKYFSIGDYTKARQTLQTIDNLHLLEDLIESLIGDKKENTGFILGPHSKNGKMLHTPVNASNNVFTNVESLEILDNLPIISCVLDYNGRFTYVNDLFVEISGYKPDEIIGRRWWRILNSSGLQQFRKVIALLSSGSVNGYKIKIKNKFGVTLKNSISIFKLNHVGGYRKPKYIVFSLDTTDLEHIKTEHRLFSESVKKSSDSIMITDDKGNIQYVNPSFCSLTGYNSEEVIGKRSKFFESSKHDENIYKKLQTTIYNGIAWEGDLTGSRKDGTPYKEKAAIFPVKNSNGEITNFIKISREIKDNLQNDDDLRHTQKIEAVGHLAGGVAHDFNNILTAIKGSAQLARDILKHGDPILEHVEDIEKAACRATNLINKLLSFSRKDIISPRPINLNDIVRDMEKMIRRLIGENINFITILRPNLSPIRIDPGQVEQLIMNLTLNARDAMPNGGDLILETDIVSIDEGNRGRHPLPIGVYVILRVVDTGQGIKKELLNKIFDPFFTTKTNGKGTGLGLSTVYSIVKQWGGYVFVDSKNGEGTTFTLYFPWNAHSITCPSQNKTQSSEKRQKTILVIEDDEIVRPLIKKILVKKNYRVFLASRCSEARLIWQEHAEEIDMVISDILLPDGSGCSFLVKLCKDNPKLKTLLMSGYTDSIIEKHLIKNRDFDFINKPFNVDQLLKRIREILGE